MSKTRVYKVTSSVQDTLGGIAKPRYVEASNPAQAMRHVANEVFSVHPITAKELADDGRTFDGVEVEIAVPPAGD